MSKARRAFRAPGCVRRRKITAAIVAAGDRRYQKSENDVRLTRLEAEDFLSYQALDLPLAEAYQVGIVGANGAGKSALLDMVLWCLFAGGRGSADELIREGSERAWVAVEFEMSGRMYRVRRERSRHTKAGESSLTFEVDGANVSKHAIPETQARIAREIGLTMEALLAGPFMVQSDDGKPRDLMHLKEAPRLDLMIELYGLTRFDAYHARAKEWGLRAHGELDVLEHRVVELETAIAGELEARRERDAQQVVHEALETEVDRLTEEVTGLREEAAALQERATRQEALEAEMEQTQLDLDTATAALSTLELQVDEKTVRLQRKPVMPPVNDVDDLNARLAEVTTELVPLGDLKERRGTLGLLWKQQAGAAKLIDHVPCQTALKDASDAEVCRQCQFLVDAVVAREALPETTAEGKDVARQITALETKSEYAATLAREHRAAVDQRTLFAADQHERGAAEEFVEHFDGQIATTRQRVDQLQVAITKGNAERLRIAQDGDRRRQLAGQLTTAVAGLEDARSERLKVERRLLDASTKLQAVEDAKARRRSVETERIRVANRAEALRLLTQAFHRDGIPKLILENGLAMIEERANEVLGRMPGGWRVDIVTQKELKSRNATAEALDVVISAAGVVRPYRMLSGGEKFRVDFALRMALATVLARRSMTTVETLWLDEGWGSQDREGREALLDAINAVADEFRLIVVVSHVPEVTDAMPQRLEVTKEDGVSRVGLA